MCLPRNAWSTESIRDFFRVPMCSIPWGPCHTTSESSSQSMGKHCSHSCRSGPAKRRSGEAEKEMTTIIVTIDKFHRTNVHRNSLDRLIQTSSEFWILESEKRGVPFGRATLSPETLSAMAGPQSMTNWHSNIQQLQTQVRVEFVLQSDRRIRLLSANQ